jgi:hypothetical protein
MSKRSELLRAALSYAERGWPVFPLYWPDGQRCSCGKSDCDSVAKHPLTAHGFLDATTDPEAIREHWKTHPAANVGLRTGTDGGVLVMDIDSRHSGEESFLALQKELGVLPNGPAVKTGNGEHLYFAYPDCGLKSRVQVKGRGGIDIRGKGGYVVAPPSQHRSGQFYHWQRKPNGKLPMLPSSWITFLAGEPAKARIATGESTSDKPVREGARNVRLTSLAGSMRRQGANEETILAALLKFNSDQCEPPLPGSEVRAVAGSIAGYPSVPHDSPPTAKYIASENGLVWLKEKKDEIFQVLLTNFTARIVADVIHDDGQERHRHFGLEARLKNRIRKFEVPAPQFGPMHWVEDQLGPQAIVYPGYNAREHAKVAIQSLSEEIATRRVFAHTGWRRIGKGKGWMYLHGAGAITASGLDTRVAVELPPNLLPFQLPAPPPPVELKAAIKSSLRMLDLTGAASTAVPLYGTIWRAALGPSDFLIHLAGRKGVGKSEWGALAQQHFGKGFNARHLPTGWSSTGNSIEGLAFVAKDALLVVDDFAPGGTGHDVSRAHREADRVVRAQGNHQGRNRMRSDSSLRPSKWPRGLILSSGEDIPRGHSTQARMLVIELGQGELDFQRLSECQQDARKGVYAKAFAGYLKWLAPQYDAIRAKFPKELAEWRDKAASSVAHKRTPEIIANLALGLRKFLAFAIASDALTKDEARQLWEGWWNALGVAASKQSDHLKSEDVVETFVALLESLLATGKGHLGGAGGCTSLGPKGQLIGWLDDDDLLLEPNTAFAEVQRLAREQGDPLPVGQKTLWKRLDDAGLISKREKGRNLIRREIAGKGRRVVCLRRDKFPSLSTKSGLTGFAGLPDQQEE